MRNWDLNSGASKLELSLQNLFATSAEVQQYWSDEAQRKFHEVYVAPWSRVSGECWIRSIAWPRFWPPPNANAG